MSNKKVGGLTRRELIASGIAAVGGLSVISQLSSTAEAAQNLLSKAAASPTIAVASKNDPAGLVRAAVDALGGMKKFVKPGNMVLVKPNMGWAGRASQACNTNPQVVAEVVRLCFAAGARQVKVMDHSVDGPESLVLDICGIGAAVKAVKAEAILANSPAYYQKVKLPRAQLLKSVDVLRDFKRANVIINVPIAKVHSGTGVTLGCKNLMGTVWDRGAWHNSASLDQCIADYAAHFKPNLTIMDAVRILLSNGPKGPGRTRDVGMVIAGTDLLAVDAYAATLFNLDAKKVGHLARAADMQVGEIDLKRVKIKHV